MIDFELVRQTLNECSRLVEELDGLDHDDSRAHLESSHTNARKERARRSQQMQFLANRLELAASLVRNEYWVARGERDALDIDRSET